MKHRFLIWLAAVLMAVFISVPALAVDDDVTTYKDDEGNTITVEVGEHDSNSGSDVIVLPAPEDGSDSGTPSGGSAGTHATPAPSGKTGSSGGSESDSDVIVLPSGDENDAQNAPEEGEDAESGEDGDDAQQADEDADADGAKAKSKSDGKLPAGTAYTLIGILSVILIAGAVYLVRSRKK